jgi:4-diphosphocytidyl-2-C-methyl-D-erythritol kinase
MIAFPNAKINLGLSIIEKRADGFHNLESCFYPIPCYDVLEVLPAENFVFQTTGIEIPGGNQGNLCEKAYQILSADYELPKVTIHLHKTVPIGAGMGGGSADGAFTLSLLNQLGQLNLGTPALENYARKLGSDCAFFIENKPKYCFGKGDEFEEVNINLSGKVLVLVNPNIHISTAEAYAGIIPKKPAHKCVDIIKLPITAWRNYLKNDFEESIFPQHKILPEIKEKLYSKGALYASMTGSGSTLYGIFEQEIDLDDFSDFWTFQAKL